MSDVSDKVLQSVADALRSQAGIKALTGSDVIPIPIENLPPDLQKMEREFSKEWWAKHHPPPPPKVYPDILGPFNCAITFDGGVPVGGWTQVSLHKDGAWNFSGHLHDSGFPSYSDSVVWAISNHGTGEVYTLTHSGHMAGTIQSGSRDDDWGNSGVNQAIADGWAGFWPPDGRLSWAMRAGVNIDSDSLLAAAKQAVGAAATIISLL
jgi:hypothetical protein